MKTTRVDITRFAPEGREPGPDVVAVEEPLEIAAAWVNGRGETLEKTIAVTMRTPSDDFDLAAGFLFCERLIAGGEAIEGMRHWGSPNKVRVALRPPARIDVAKLDRRFYTSSSCGVCGKRAIDALFVANEPLPESEPLDARVVHALPAILHEAQSAFHDTGGVHGAAVVSRDGSLLCLREDIGRHNAVDKVIGSFVREQSLPSLRDVILAVSSRGSYEIVQKAIVAGIGAVAFVGGPSSLAIELAARFNVTLLGFVRDGRFNVYAGRVR
jgi:FdhD protein